jgi:hypothetical protein
LFSTVQPEAALWLLKASVDDIIHTISLIDFSSALKKNSHLSFSTTL